MSTHSQAGSRNLIGSNDTKKPAFAGFFVSFDLLLEPSLQFIKPTDVLSVIENLWDGSGCS